jgi:Xaa-Pro aminopeptidase
VRDAIRTAKLDRLLIPIMEEWGVEAWVTLTRDPCDDMTNVIWERDIQLDPIAEYIGAERVTVPAAFIFTTSGDRIAIAERSDAEYIQSTGIYKKVLTYTYNRAKGHSGFGELLGSALRKLDPETIGLNFSQEEGVADGLTVGMKLIFDAAVGPELAARVVSAERVVISLWNRKVEKEVELITRSAVQSAQLTDEALRAIEPGVTTARTLFDDIRSGATGEEVDTASRSVVTDAGFDEYGHATGHTTGVWVHGLGVIIGPRWKAYGEKVAMPMHVGDVYAVEPSIRAYSKEHGGTLRIHFQEMVIVEEDGARYLTEPVTELMLIR